MPYIVLGNLTSSSFDHSSQYTHKYFSGSKKHNFTRLFITENNIDLGYCKCTASYNRGDIITVNNIENITVINPEKIKVGSWIYFIVEDNKLFILEQAEQFSVPNGDTIEPLNDPAIWCACAGINWYEIGCPTAEDLTSSEEYCFQLFNNANALAYYRRSSNLIKSTLLGTNVLRELQQSSFYYETPYVTNNPGIFGEVVSTNTTAYDGSLYGAFSLSTNYRADTTPHGGQWVQLTLPEPIWPCCFFIQPTVKNLMTNCIFSWQCSEDGEHWIDLDIQDAVGATAVTQTFYNKIGFTKKCRYFRLYVKQHTAAEHLCLRYGKIGGIL